MAVKERRLDVMLSSTSKDLPEHRKQAVEAANRAGFYVDRMENLTAMTQQEDAISVSMAMVEQAEVYIGIFGMRYGFRPVDKTRNPNELSITEMEYRRAKELGMPILIFVMDEEHPGPDTNGLKAAEARKITDAFYERDPRGEEKLDLLKKELTGNHIVAFFKSADDLYGLMLQALVAPSVKAAARQYADMRDAEPPADPAQLPAAPKATIPFPPDIYAYPPYSGQNAMFVGRRHEMDMLDEWANPQGQHPMLALEAIGGMGKSALTWRWLQDRAVPFDGVFWYSFYEGGALMSECIRHALAYVTRSDPASLREKSFTDILAELVHTLQHGRYLIVLDGLERVLVAYHRWNASQMQDDAIEEGRDYRACTDPRDNDVLRQLAGCAPSRILITSRLMPAALQDSGGFLDGVKHAELKGLSPTDARRLWKDGGIVWGDEGVLDTFINQFGRHSLLLKLLIDIIRKNRRFNGDFDRWYKLHGAGIDVFQEMKAKRHHILEFAYEGLSAEARKLLSQMAVLGNAVDIDTLNVFNPYLNMPEAVPEPRRNPFGSLPVFRRLGETEEAFKKRQEENSVDEQYERDKAVYDAYLKAKADYEASSEFKQAIHRFDAMLQDLEERGLIWWDQVNLQYDLHPVVRGYASAQLGDSDKPVTYDRIYNFFEEQERGTRATRFTSFKEMQNLIAMYNALIGAGKFDAAADLFINRMRWSLVEEDLGLYHKAYELLLPLFPHGLSELPIANGERQQGLILNQMGLVLNYLRRHEEALRVRASEFKNGFEFGTSDSIISLMNYSASLGANNFLAQALRSNQYGLQQAELLGSDNSIWHAQFQLMLTYGALGQRDELRAAYESFLEYSPDRFFEAAAHRHYANSLLREGRIRGEVEAALSRADEMNKEMKSALLNRFILIVYGDLALREREWDAAINYYGEAARIGNEQGLRDSEAWGGLARTYAAKGNLPHALRIIRDGVDDHGFAAARVYLANGDIPDATEAALEFYRWAWAQGEPYVRGWELEQARAILRELGQPEPRLPVWDDSHYEPFTYEEEVVALIEKLKSQPPKSKRDDFDFDDDEDEE